MISGVNHPQRLTMFALRAEQTFGVDSVIARLRTAIDLGFLQHGEMLPKEALLAKELHVTAFTLREALAQLRAEGLVDTKPGRGGGTFVNHATKLVREKATNRLRELSAVTLRDLADWKAMLLGESAELAANRASPANIARLLQYKTRIAEAKDALTACRAHARFDVELASVAQSVRLSAAALQIYEDFGWLLALAHEEQEYTDLCANTVGEILDKITQGEGIEAGNVARSRTRVSFDNIVRLRLKLIAESTKLLLSDKLETA
ncbi:putative L-lactate dehydrogenase operon regulatory protein [compost metagenome]